jgi:hypothetical protein
MESPSLQDAIDFLCTPGLDTDLQSLITRYHEINKERPKLFFAPAEKRILEKLVWPLRHAKSSYTVGNYLGTISLCGMVAEMVAILLFEMSEFRLNNRLMSETDQNELFGSSFEKLGQDRRVKILQVYGLISTEMRKAFETIRLKRKKYLHFWSQDYDTLPSDAVVAYNAAVLIVVHAVGQDIKEGKLILNTNFITYLKRLRKNDVAKEGE